MVAGIENVGAQDVRTQNLPITIGYLFPLLWRLEIISVLIGQDVLVCRFPTVDEVDRLCHDGADAAPFC